MLEKPPCVGDGKKKQTGSSAGELPLASLPSLFFYSIPMANPIFRSPEGRSFLVAYGGGSGGVVRTRAFQDVATHPRPPSCGTGSGRAVPDQRPPPPPFFVATEESKGACSPFDDEVFPETRNPGDEWMDGWLLSVPFKRGGRSRHLPS